MHAYEVHGWKCTCVSVFTVIIVEVYLHWCEASGLLELEGNRGHLLGPFPEESRENGKVKTGHYELSTHLLESASTD
jgi:hypothetical protein